MAPQLQRILSLLERNRSRPSSSSNVPIKSVAKLAKSFGLATSLTENLGDFRYKLCTVTLGFIHRLGDGGYSRRKFRCRKFFNLRVRYFCQSIACFADPGALRSELRKAMPMLGRFGTMADFV